MRGIGCLFSILLLFLFSCQQEREATPGELILGEWMIYDGFYTRPGVVPSGFYFNTNDTCEIRPGYITYKYGRIAGYNGNTTSYRIVGDTLQLFNLKTNEWENNKFEFLHPDTLRIKYESVEGYSRSASDDFQMEYIRMDTTLKSEDFDQLVIIFEDQGLLHKAISLNNRGELFYWGGLVDTLSGSFVSDEGERVFRQISNLFRREDFANIPVDTVPVLREDIDPIYGSFGFLLIKDNKTIEARQIFYDDLFLQERRWDYSPQFLYTLIQALFLEQQMPIEKLDLSESIYDANSNFQPVFFFANNQGKETVLRSIDNFYLWTLLLQAKPVDVDFTPIYTVNTNEYTDGRYYSFKNKQDEWITLDIGFNFIENNKLE